MSTSEKRITMLVSVFTCIALVIGLLTTPVAQAYRTEVPYWSGDGGDDNWDTDANWQQWDDTENQWENTTAPEDGNIYIDLTGEQIDMNTALTGANLRIHPNHATNTDTTTVNVLKDFDGYMRWMAGAQSWYTGTDYVDTSRDATLNIHSDATFTIDNLKNTGTNTDGATATINVLSGGEFISQGDAELAGDGSTSFNGSGILNIESGAGASFEGDLEVNSKGGGLGRVTVSGGDLSVDTNSQFKISSSDAEFRVEGTGQNLEGTGSNTIEVGELRTNGGLLDLRVDAGGVTTTQVQGDYVIQYDTPVLLNLEFLDEQSPNYGKFTAMEWDGNFYYRSSQDFNYYDMFGLYDDDEDGHLTLDDIPADYFAWAEGVDREVWSADFYDTGNSGYMEITAVPEPSTLVLLGLAGLLLMKPRRRRRRA